MFYRLFQPPTVNWPESGHWARQPPESLVMPPEALHAEVYGDGASDWSSTFSVSQLATMSNVKSQMMLDGFFHDCLAGKNVKLRIGAQVRRMPNDILLI